MRTSGAPRTDFAPSGGLFRLLESPKRERLDEILRDRIELARLNKQTESDLAELRDAETWLAEHSEQAVPADFDSNWLTEAARKADEKERGASAQFQPVIFLLKSALEPPTDPFEADVQQLLRNSIKILEGWLAFYRGFHAMLSRQAAEHRAVTEKVLRAKPMKGEVDWAELSREHIARYPKIRARLAE
jgi:hypothetical protein